MRLTAAGFSALSTMTPAVYVTRYNIEIKVVMLGEAPKLQAACNTFRKRSNSVIENIRRVAF